MNAGRTIVRLVVLSAATAMLAACAAPASRYRSDAVAFIASDTVFEAYGVDFENIDCAEPDSTDEGATLVCRADASGGQSYVFTLTIIGSNELELTDIALAAASLDSTPDSTPESTGPESTAPESAGATAPESPAPPTAAAVTAPSPAAASTAPATTVPPTTAATTAAPTTAVPAGHLRWMSKVHGLGRRSA